MPVNHLELIRAAEVVAEKEDLKVAVKYSLASGGLTATTTVLGGLLAGPVGLFIGGSLGGLSSWLATKDKFRSVVMIIRELNEEQKHRLAQHVRIAVKDFDVTDIITLTTLLTTDNMLREAVTIAVKNFVQNDLRMQLC